MKRYTLRLTPDEMDFFLDAFVIGIGRMSDDLTEEYADTIEKVSNLGHLYEDDIEERRNTAHA